MFKNHWIPYRAALVRNDERELFTVPARYANQAVLAVMWFYLVCGKLTLNLA